MKTMIKSGVLAVAMLGLGVAQAAAEYPERQVTMIVPFGAGGGSDRVARTVDRFWQEQTGESFNFKYQPGAAGAVGTAEISRAKPDGYTVGIVNLPNMVVQPVAGTGTFALDSFDYIGRVNADPIVLMVPETSPYQTLEAFLAAAKDAPGTMTLAITGTMGAAHLAALQMMDGAGVEVTLVPTQGGSNTVARIAGGHVTAGLIGLGLFTSQENGRALAVTAAERSDFTPDVPTFSEKGIPIDLSTARIIVAPEGLPDDVLTHLRETLQSVTESEGFVAASADQGQGAIWQDGAALEQAVMAMEQSTTELLRKYELID
ncbi:tripartite tricarboxylate transporter substrate binding protein [Marinovum sp.]|uniref:Bug family tripartite tricarboxylate transporter substrate binding protein n=1 Tax=Marinovum sp. TaxID=2024839 RepID=UPI002B2675D4|nr:tripartite tricarboxylate transporter substrate binding protein [Marinovum sp.]